MHIRAQIRKALGAALSGVSATAGRVHVNRGINVPGSALPALFVTTPQEGIAPFGLDAPQMVRREMLVVVEALVTGSTLDSAADQIGLDVERIITAAGNLGGLTKKPLDLERIEFDVDEVATPPTGSLRMFYRALTITSAAAPQTVI